VDGIKRLDANPKFEDFEVDLRTGELLRSGVRVKLQDQPFKILVALLERPGELVTREELRRRIWPTESFGDFDHAVNIAVGKLRAALADSPETPRFIETLPRRGYRFLAPVLPLHADSIGAKAEPHPAAGSRRALILLAGALLTVVAFISWRLERRTTKVVPAPTTPLQEPFTSYEGNETAPTFSPDGSQIAFAWDGNPSAHGKGVDLYVKTIGSETLVRLTEHPSEWLSAAWSPDGTQIAFHRLAGAETGIYMVPALGGPERKLRSTRIPYSVAAPISWSPDGKWIGFSDQFPNDPHDHMFLLSPTTLETQSIPPDPQCLHEANPTFSHRGDKLASVCVRTTRDFLLYWRSTPNGTPHQLIELSNFIGGLCWSADDTRLIFFQAKENGTELDEVSIADRSLRQLSFAYDPNWPAVSPKGDKLAYVNVSGISNIWRKDILHPEQPAVKLIHSTQGQGDAQYSPDGHQIAFDAGIAGFWEVWMAEADGSKLVQLSKLNSLTDAPRWSPDGTKIAFGWKQAERSEIYIADALERVPRKFETDVREISNPSWSHDGKWIYFRSYGSLGQKLYRSPANGGNAIPLPGGPDGVSVEESVDGDTVYFAARESHTPLHMLSLTEKFPESIVPGMPEVLAANLWTVAKAGIFFVPAEAPKSLRYFDFRTRNGRELFNVEKDFAGGLSLSPEERYVLFSQADEANSDIVLVRNFR
jgi:Tol biopolymer transport system component/DNA-binding winged helix-turn-helix (wHTH) protein